MMTDRDNDYLSPTFDPDQTKLDSWDPFNPRVQRFYEIHGHLPAERDPAAAKFLLRVGAFGLAVLALNLLLTIIAAHPLEFEVSFSFALILSVLAILAYRTRCRKRTLFGVIEILFGIASILWASHGLFYWFLSRGAGDPQLGLNTTIPAIGGLYIVVRGLSNIEEGRIWKSDLKNSSTLSQTWYFLFYWPSPKPPAS
jgi:hypothetical protein